MKYLVKVTTDENEVYVTKTLETDLDDIRVVADSFNLEFAHGPTLKMELSNDRQFMLRTMDIKSIEVWELTDD